MDYNTTTSAYNFNSVTLSGTCPVVYNFEPTAMDADADICVVPDYELVSLLAVSKMWADDPEGEQKSHVYFEKAQQRLENLWQNDVNSFRSVKSTLPISRNQSKRVKE
jgi:hypothetical protein